jgi:hypothetical protein
VRGPYHLNEIVEKADTEKPFTTYDIQACLYDAHRVRCLRDAVERSVKPGDVVVDAGSGTGVLGLFAARAGAAKVYCLELNTDFKEVIEENARRNGLADRIFYEPQLQIINNLRQFLKPDGRIVPRSMTNYVELIDAQEELYGLNFTFDGRFTDLDGDRSLTDSAQYLFVDFANSSDTDPVISREVTVEAARSGTANAFKITYDIEFSAGVWTSTHAAALGSGEDPGSWPALLNPQIVFLSEKVEVVQGERYDVSLEYRASANPVTCKAVVTSARSQAAPGDGSPGRVNRRSPDSRGDR